MTRLRCVNKVEMFPSTENNTTRGVPGILAKDPVSEVSCSNEKATKQSLEMSLVSSFPEVCKKMQP